MSDSKLSRPPETFFSQAMRDAQGGDGERYRELLSAARVLLLAYTRRALGRMGKRNPALEEDMVQEVLLAVHEKRHTYDPQRPFLPWLFAIARYKLIDYGRAEKRRPRNVALESVEDALAAPIFADPATASDLKALISTLPERTRNALELVKLEGLSIAEASARSSMSESALKVAIHRGIKTLRARLKKEERT